MLNNINEKYRALNVDYQDAINILSIKYHKVLKVNLSKDTFRIVRIYDEESQDENGFNDKMSVWLDGFIKSGYVPEDEIEGLLEFVDPVRLANEFSSGTKSLSYLYRRKVNDEFRWVKMELIPSVEYTEEDKIILLYIWDVHDEYVKDIEHRKKIEQANKAYEEAFIVANRANNAKTQFLSKMSHNIRTPLNAIIGMTAIASTYINDNERVADALEKINISSKHLLNIVNEMLDMGRIEAGKFSLSNERIELNSLLKNTIDMVRTQAEERGHALNVDLSGIKHNHVLGDSFRLQQLLINFLSNAVKYTNDNGSISFVASERDTDISSMGCYQFVIEDNGIGMTKEFQSHIFEPFKRENINSEIQGTGLGMAISYNLVKMMHGNIEVSSELSKGTRFVVTLFLNIQDEHQKNVYIFDNKTVLLMVDNNVNTLEIADLLNGKEIDVNISDSEDNTLYILKDQRIKFSDSSVIFIDLDKYGVELVEIIREIIGDDSYIVGISVSRNIEITAKMAGVDELIDVIDMEQINKILESVFGEVDDTLQRDISRKIANVKKHDYSQKRIMIVEDNEYNEEIISEIIKKTGAKMDFARNGKEAIALYKNNDEYTYDMILMDVHMPIIGGYEASVVIRQMEKADSKTIPIIAMTASVFNEDLVKAKKSGMNDCILKPINLDKMINTIDKYI